jgi:hypothetical protein
MEHESRDLREQYRLAVEEYRFQVDLNWRRSEYFFVLNIGVLVAGATLLASNGLPEALVGLVFVMGALLATMSFLANDSQHSYYKAARETKERLEEKLELGDVALRTTPGMGSGIARLGRVSTFLKTMLVAIALVDLVGAGISLHDVLEEAPVLPQARVVVRIPRLDRSPLGTVVVISDGNGHIVSSSRAAPPRIIKPFALDPGRYEVSVLSRRICTQAMDVSTAPLQLVVVACGRSNGYG